MNKIICNKKGFSLLEVLIGLVLLAIGMLAIASLQIASVRGNFFSQNITEATYVAQGGEKDDGSKYGIEYLKSIPFNDARLSAGDHDDGSQTISGIVYNLTYHVKNDAAGYKVIKYTVRWNDGVDHHISFSTIRYL